jgi:hypothetical protein
MNYGELQNEVLSHQLNDTKYRPYVKSWLNEGQRFVTAQTDIRSQYESLATTLTDPQFDLPDDYSRLIEVIDTTDSGDGRHLYPMEIPDFHEAPASYGPPEFYAVIGNTVYLFPYPADGTEITLNYYRQPVLMTTEGDEPEIPDTYHHLLIRWALYRAFQRENDYEAAGYWRGEFENDLMKMRGEVQHDTFDGPRQVPGTWDDETSPGPVRLNNWV